MSEPIETTQLDPALARVPRRTPTLPPATRTNTYVVGTAQLCVVDPAPSDASERNALVAYLQARRQEGATLQALVLTHHHHDHVGAAAFLHDELGLPVLAHAETARRVNVPIAETLDEGDALPCDGPAWTAVFTPGHAAGHLCFHRADDGSVLAGDMVAGIGTILVDPDEGSMRDYLASLERLIALSPRVLYPAHGFPLEPAVEQLQHYLAHRRARSQAVLERIRLGDRSPEAIVPHVYVGTPLMMFPFAARSVLSMLIHHEQDGLVRRDGEAWLPT